MDENVFVIKGTLHCRYLENGEEKECDVQEHEVLRVLHSVHTIENDTDQTAEFVVFRYIPQGKDNREAIKKDKTAVKR